MNNSYDEKYPSIHFVRRLSETAENVFSFILPNVVFNLLSGLFKLTRPARIVMIAALTWVCAFVAEVPHVKSWLVTSGGMFLAMAGFAADVYTDRERDKKSSRPWPINPIAAGIMSPFSARMWIGFFVLSGLSLGVMAHPLTLIPGGMLLLTYWGLATGLLDGPLGRTVTLGLLQALYVLLAAAATGTITGLMFMISAVLLTAMIGARAAADIRDFPGDTKTDTRSLVKVLGIRKTSWILPVAITISFAISLLIYTSGAFDRDYLILTLIGFSAGFILAWIFPFYPTPNFAFILGWPFWGIGILYMLALYFGSF